MKYIKNRANYIAIPDNFHQRFFHDPNSQTNLTQIVNLKYTGVLDDSSIKILEFIYDVRFATLEQIEMFCGIKEIEYLEERLNTMFKAFAVNKFGMVDIERYANKLPPDAKAYYCLGYAGMQLLQQFSGRDYIDWEPGKTIQGARNISKHLFSTEIYLHMLSCGVPLINTEYKPEFSVNKSTLRPMYGYSFKLKDGSIDYILTDIMYASDKISDIRYKLRLYEGLLTSNLWGKYFPDASRQPMMVIYTEDDATALALAREISTGTKLSVYLLSTMERTININMFETGAFLRYDGNDMFTEIGYSF